MLTENQIASYQENGFLIIESFFNDIEIDLIKEEIENVSHMKSDGHILEEDKTVRSVLGPHLLSPLFHNMVHLDRIVLPVKQLLESEEIYIHQVKINHKRALSGERWDWHQDLYYWHRMDGLPASGALSVGLFLDDVSHESGPLMLIPGSHREGMVDLPVNEKYDEISWESNFSSDLTFKIGAEKLRQIMDNRNVISAVGKKGFLVFFHDSVFHGSNNNMSPIDRKAVYFSYNKVCNAPPKQENPRPKFAANTDSAPIMELVSSLT